MNCIIILIVLALVAVLYVKSTRENLGFPFDKLYQEPRVNVVPRYSQPYCMDQHGNPIPCSQPCQDWNPACKYDFPVPVLSDKIGAYSPSKWCPGPPVC